MPDLQIGTRVKVRAFVEFGYEYTESRIRTRKLFRNSLNEPSEMIVVGLTHRRLGIFIPAQRYGGISGMEPDDDQGEFKPTGTVLVYQVRRTLRNKIIEVLPEDLEPCT